MNYIFFNNSIITVEEAKIPITDRAFLYGDGLFESLVFKNNSIQFLSDHFLRLTEGLESFNLKIPSFFTLKFLEEQIFKLIKLNLTGNEGRIKINCWRYSGGLYTPVNNEMNLLITIGEKGNHNVPFKKVLFYDDIKKGFSTISKFKTINAAPYIFASIKKKELGVDDMILSDFFGNISECTASNIFFIKGDVLYTPHFNSGCIEGIMKKQVLKVAEEHNINYQEGLYQKDVILDADFAFTSNISGLVPISVIETRILNKTSEMFFLLKSTLNN